MCLDKILKHRRCFVEPSQPDLQCGSSKSILIRKTLTSRLTFERILIKSVFWVPLLTLYTCNCDLNGLTNIWDIGEAFLVSSKTQERESLTYQFTSHRRHCAVNKTPHHRIHQTTHVTKHQVKNIFLCFVLMPNTLE